MKIRRSVGKEPLRDGRQDEEQGTAYGAPCCVYSLFVSARTEGMGTEGGTTPSTKIVTWGRCNEV